MSANGEVKRILGTGFWVTPNRVLACFSVESIEESAKLFIQEYLPFGGEEKLKACQLLWSRSTDKGEDMLVLEVDKKEAAAHQVAFLASNPFINQSEQLMAWNYSTSDQVMQRIACQWEQTVSGAGLFAYQANGQGTPTICSGSAVLNRKTGKVIGFISRSKTGKGYLIISLYSVFSWLQEFRFDLAKENRKFHKKHTYWSALLPKGNKVVFFSARPPHLPVKYKNRNNYIKEINQLLQTSRSRVYLYGMRGLGKTTIAADYCQRYLGQYDFIAWCFCGQGIKQGMVKDIIYERLGLSFDREEQELYEYNYRQVLERMEDLEGKGLLVLDGVDDPWKVMEVPVLNNWDVIISTKLNSVKNTYEAIEVGVLDLASARKLFFDYYTREKDSPYIDRLLEAINYHTLSIELLAKNLEQFYLPEANIQWLYERICEGGILSPPAIDVETEYTHAKGEKNFRKIIESIFSYVENLTEEELEYLLVFSVLPSSFVSLHRLCDLLDIVPANLSNTAYVELLKCLHRLHAKGWLEREEHEQGVRYRLHPLIGESVRSLYEPKYKEGYQEKYWNLGAHLLLKLDYSQSNYEVIAYFRFVEAYLYALDVKDMGTIEGELCLAYLFALMELGEFESAFRIAEKGLEILAHLEDDRIEMVLRDLITCCDVLDKIEDLERYQLQLKEYEN